MRITEKMLENLATQINKAAKTPLKPYSYDYDTTGNYHIDSAYGGFRLCQINKTGGVMGVNTTGFVSKKDLYNFMDGFLKGIKTERAKQ